MYIGGIVKYTVIYGILCIAIIALSMNFLVPFVSKYVPGIWGNLISAVITVLVMAPFLRSIVMKGYNTEEFKTIWNENTSNRAPLLATVFIRAVIALGFVTFVLLKLFHFSVAIIVPVALVLIWGMLSNERLKRQTQRMEKTFNNNLRSRELQAQYNGDKAPEYATALISKDLHLSDFEVPPTAPWVGNTLAELDFGKRFGIQVASILRGTLRINIPKASDRIFPGDKLQVIGTDAQLEEFSTKLTASAATVDQGKIEASEMHLHHFRIGQSSPFLGKSIKQSGIRNKYRCLIAGVETPDGKLYVPDLDKPFAEGDVVWVVGEEGDLSALQKTEGEMRQSKT